MAAVPLALQLLPMLPGMVSQLLALVQAIRTDPATPAEARAALNSVLADLDRTALAVAAVQLPNARG